MNSRTLPFNVHTYTNTYVFFSYANILGLIASVTRRDTPYIYESKNILIRGQICLRVRVGITRLVTGIIRIPFSRFRGA